MREVFMERSIAARATDSSLGVRGRAGFMLAACAACTFHAPTYAGDSWTGNDKREHFAYGAMTAVVVQGATTTDSPMRGLKNTRITQQVELTVSVVAGTEVSVTLEGHSPEGFTTNWWNARLQYELIKR